MFASEGDSVNVGRQGSAAWADRWDDPPRRPTGDDAAVGVARRLQARLDRHLWLLERLRVEQPYPEPPGFPELLESGRRMRRDTESILVLAGQEPGAHGTVSRRLSDLLADAAAAAEEPARVEVRPAPSATVAAGAAAEFLHVLAELVDDATAVYPGARLDVASRVEARGIVVDVAVEGGTRRDASGFDDANGSDGRRVAVVAEQIADRSRYGITLSRPLAGAPHAGSGPVASVHCPPSAVTLDEPRPAAEDPLLPTRNGTGSFPLVNDPLRRNDDPLRPEGDPLLPTRSGKGLFPLLNDPLRDDDPLRERDPLRDSNPLRDRDPFSSDNNGSVRGEDDVFSTGNGSLRRDDDPFSLESKPLRRDDDPFSLGTGLPRRENDPFAPGGAVRDDDPFSLGTALPRREHDPFSSGNGFQYDAFYGGSAVEPPGNGSAPSTNGSGTNGAGQVENSLFGDPPAPAYSPSASSQVDELFGPLLDLPLEPIDDRYATPIFEAIASAWFRDPDADGGAGGTADGAAPIDWESPNDTEWREAAARAAQPEPAATTTSSGLPRRRPGGQLVPPPRAQEPNPVGERVPDRVRDRLSTYQRGLNQGRHRAPGEELDAW
ncbi:hypothetical protein [Pseudonocardia xinjiangensis]|uniref:histidine kinase n=1 Tax=Pseudonocardia xinjiangensis TaxID=75289 RepID=A0ABX1RCE3_9PSEU|nr:hypothetical protein [Pseudonocardia xinjiangensis]NMH78046.1 hypothetical protein [Pseudonocardia xinjiangensis]